MKFTLEYIAKSCGGKLSAGSNPQRTICGFYTDNRMASIDKMFLAIRGERVDGNSFVPALLSDGHCAMTNVIENLAFSGDCIYVEDVRDALQQLARLYRQTVLNNIPVIGITGSVGKTTTKEMVSLALSSAFNVYKTQGNFNSQIGLPQTVLGCEKSAECAIIELGMSMPGEMERISRCAIPQISIITNIGYSHIENLGSREAIRDEKLKIALFSPENAIMILNGDEPLLRDIDIKDKTVYYISVEDEKSEAYATDVCEGFDSVSFNAHVFGKIYPVKLSARGKHFVLNALFALASAHLLGIDVLKAAQSLSSYESDGKRQYIYTKDNHTIISDCYNAAPESMKAAISVLASFSGRKIAVLGDMLELGSVSEKLHREVGTYTTSKVDVLVTYGKEAMYIFEASQVQEKYAFNKDDRDSLKLFLENFIREGDAVLYKASNGMNLGGLIV